MAKFIVRRLFLMLVTMLAASMLIFVVSEAAPGNVARNILGKFANLNRKPRSARSSVSTGPLVTRYLAWLIGSDWMASRQIGMPLQRLTDAARLPAVVGCRSAMALWSSGRWKAAT